LKSIESDLAGDASLFRELLESAPDAMVIVNGSGTIVLVNSQTESLFGLPRAELLGKSVEMLVPERFRPLHPVHRQRYMAEPRTRGMGTGLELYGLRSNGDEFPVEISLSPLRTGTRTLVSASIRDISGRRKEEAKFRGLLESAPDAVVIVDHQGEIALINSQTERLFGYSREELLGRSVEILVPVRFQDFHLRHREKYFGEPRVREMGAGLDLLGRRKNGEEFPVEISLSPLETGEGLLVSASIRDVTERKRAQKILHEKNLELESASRAKDRFLASMSHELRTPLNAIIGFTGTLLMRLPGPLNAEQERQLRTVKASARHLLSLINDLLDLAKIESGELTVERESVAVRPVVDEVLATLRPLAEAKGLILENGLSAEDALVSSNRRSLSQILINLASNAIKFTDKGSVRIEMGPGREANFVEIRVVDTGIGIRPEDQTRLFRAFSQVHGGGDSRAGTGLGLHLSSKLAELLGGTLGFESAVGEGSTFVLTLPRE
jgi:protein-histidine pros-kinase